MGFLLLVRTFESEKKKPTENSESSTGESSWAIGNNYDGNKTMEVGGA